MRRNNYNSFSTYALIACLAVALLLGQTFKLHMHIGHSDVSSSATTSHTVDLHIDASAMHSDSHNSTHHQSLHANSLDEEHHNDEIDISFSSLLKKSMSLNQFVFFFFIISIVLSLLLLSRFLRVRYFTSKQSSCYHFFQPLLRAPPVHPA